MAEYTEDDLFEILDQIRKICENTPHPKEGDSNNAIDEILDLVNL